ncbi:MAG: hypothetical protein U9O87_00690, partial [Verrucomicrobiota bacterium]|nr:hypothetical protein [Verrucomicrobiota bacterium]
KLNAEYIQGKDEESEKATTYNLSMDYDLAQRVDEKRFFKLDFRVKTKPKRGSSGLSVNAELSGFFSFPEGTEEDEMQYIIRVNGCSMLYSLLRGQIAMISGSFPGGKVNLPSMVMQDQIKGIEDKKAKQLGKNKKKRIIKNK